MLGITYERNCEIMQALIAKRCGVLIGLNNASNFILWLQIKHGITCGIQNNSYRIYYHVYDQVFCHIESVTRNEFKQAFGMYRNEYPLFNYMSY
jgi:hypothetical protein